MAKVEVLIAAMHQKDTGLYQKMNLQTDAVICNQADRFEAAAEMMPNGCKVRMFTTPERGVGKNRNLALTHASADICLFADDDLIYADGYEKIITGAFEKYPKAGAVLFNVPSLNKDRPSPVIKKNARVCRLTATAFGAYMLAVKREAVLKADLRFSLLFGGGAKYGSGEDTVFIFDLIKKGVPVYKVKDKIAEVRQEKSTWFAGYTDQYYFDKGALYCAMTGKYAKIAMLLPAVKSYFRGKKGTPFFKILRLMRAGIDDFRAAIPEEIEKICVVAQAYPMPGHAADPFVEQLVCAFMAQGVQCDVIAPRSISNSLIRKNPLPPRIIRAKTPSGAGYTVYSPRFISVSDGLRFLERINAFFFRRAAMKTVKKHAIRPDVFYAHFFQNAGFAAAALSKKYRKPFFVACGENSFDSLDALGLRWVRGKFKDIAGVIAVSTENRRKVITRSLAAENKIRVFQNAVDHTVFRPKDKKAAREKLGVDPAAFVVCFVGRRVPVKGALRLSAALKDMENIQSFFIGRGAETPDCGGVLFCGELPHKAIPDYLSAADVFILPTLSEGMSNAVIEAMACGLPVISSDLPFNRDILTPENAVLIDPNDINAIRNAILKLKNDPDLKNKMAAAALKTAEGLDIQTRAVNILRFMNERRRKGSAP